MILEYADISFDEQQVKSNTYDDIYFNADGISESQAVFIEGNKLVQRWKKLPRHSRFTIAEIGFGTGLNFFTTASEFFKEAPEDAILSYCAVEKNPIKLQQLKKLHRGWRHPQLREALYAQYPHNHAGFHLIKIHPRIDLILLFDEAEIILPELAARVDAWFLDGFAPSKNPDCWTAYLAKIMASKSWRGTTLATFSVAGSVRENLQEAGFSVHKVPGFGDKKEMLVGEYRNSNKNDAFWTDLPVPKQTVARRVAVVGAGFAGATVANSLAEKGVQVDVFHDPKKYPPASAVPLAIPYFQPSLVDTPMRRLHLQSWLHSNRILSWISRDVKIWQPQAITLEALDEVARLRHRRIFQQKLLNDDYWQLDANDNIVFYGSGVIRPPQLIRYLLNHDNIIVKNAAISNLHELEHYGYDAIVLATAYHSELLPARYASLLKPLFGQAVIVKAEFQPSVTCNRYSILPSPDGKHAYVGSIYAPNELQTTANLQYRQELMQVFAGTYPNKKFEHSEDFAAIRASSSDYFPFIGPMPQAEEVINDYGIWSKDRNIPVNAPMQYAEPICYMHSGLGSKGSLTSFLGGDILAAMICGIALPIPASLLPNILPVRSIIRQIVRGTS
ncbi:MAG: tRNA (5-methylaminomethyl-2-thiouridine)(34)-methyltransferase MnmD [Cardiobacteriaceae bacterium]|nr:tRNA (5-methylaminomethyl-2-thiouridine)(34)-methyltransferase MnmD [Cardiobacteriaceae bacterium]